MADALRILVTGFEPFGGSPVNPSAMAAESLVHGRFPGAEVRALVLPVVGGTELGSARAALDHLIDVHRPAACVSFGEAHVRGEVSVERVAVNLRDYRIADNSGAFAEDSPVVDGAPDARFATLPVRAIVDAVRAEGIPAGLSLAAGTYLCNAVMFHSLERAARGLAPTISGFVHVPQLEAQHVLRPTDARPITERELLAAASAVLRTVVEHCRNRD